MKINIKETLSLRGYIPLFQSKPLMLLMINIIFMFVPYWIFVGMSPLLYMKDLGVSFDPHKIGVLGFSAGGHLVAAIGTHFKKRLYPAIDAADQESCRPDFGISLYPGHFWINKNKFELNPNVSVTSKTPPMFLLQAENDHEDNVNNSLVYYIELKNAGVPVEMHLYAEGGHAFGLRRTKFPITAWPQLVETWLNSIGMTN